MTVKKIILVGCGNIGSRHLQAIAKLSCGIQVNIVEPNANAQTLAKSRLNEITYDITNHEFFWHKSISELKDVGDLVIVTTHAVGRVDLMLDLINKGNTRFLIEKLVCQSVNEYKILLEKMEKHDAKGWVNTNYRYFEGYKKIKKLLEGQEIINLSVFTHSKNGLATNSIHFIDLFAWLAEDKKIKLDGKFLSDKLVQNKRGESFAEFSGTITGATKNGSFVSMSFLPDLDESVIVNISAGNGIHLIVDETNGEVLSYGDIGNSNLEFKFEFVSSTTTSAVNDIFAQDDCLLPSLTELFDIHSEIFRIFTEHLNKSSDENIKLCPIT